MKLLERIANLLPVGHREAVQKVLAAIRKRSKLDTSRAIQNEATRLLGKIAGSNSAKVGQSKLASYGKRIDSGDHNENMENVFINLQALYRQTELVGAIQEQQRLSIVDDFSKARAAVLKLVNDARVFATRNQNPEYDDIKLVNFNVARNVSKNSPVAPIDPDSRLLKLPELMRRRHHLEHQGVNVTKATVEVVGGQKGHLGSQFPPVRATDAKPETFWGEIVYADVPVQQKYVRWGPNQHGKNTELINGPYVRYTLSFHRAERINQVRVLPFSNHPVKVIEISYRPTGASLIRHPVPNFTVEEGLDWIEYNFEAVVATDIEVVLAQETHHNLIVHVPKHVLYATDFLLRLLQHRTNELGEMSDPFDVNFGGNHEIYQEAISDLSELVAVRELEKASTTEIDLAGKTVLSMGEMLTAFNPDLKSLVAEASAYTDQLPAEFKDGLETINKVEYIVGAREIECNYVIYSPVGYYESEKFEPAATIAQARLEVDERHPEFITQYGDVRRTATEWEVEFAPDRRVPIFPANHAEGGYLPVKGERLLADPATFYAVTRFASMLMYAVVRCNDELLVAGVDYVADRPTEYGGKLRIAIAEDRFDRNKIYTIDYFADSNADTISVLEMFESKAFVVPETHQNTGPNNEIKLKYTPYVHFGVVNSDDFEYSETHNSFQYFTPTGSYHLGHIELYPDWLDDGGARLNTCTGVTSVTGYAIESTTIYSGTPDWNVLPTAYFDDPYRYYLTLADIPGARYEVDTVINSGNLLLASVPELRTGLVGNAIDLSGQFVGATTEGSFTGYLSNMPYTLEVVYKAGEQIFGFDSLLYAPLEVYVGGSRATNRSSYTTLEQPAFNVGEVQDGEYEYLHDGKMLYFNQPITDTEVQVYYRWQTQYVKVNCLMRANKVISPTVTPQVNEYRLLLSTTIL